MVLKDFRVCKKVGSDPVIISVSVLSKVTVCITSKLADLKERVNYAENLMKHDVFPVVSRDVPDEVVSDIVCMSWRKTKQHW